MYIAVVEIKYAKLDFSLHKVAFTRLTYDKVIYLLGLYSLFVETLATCDFNRLQFFR